MFLNYDQIKSYWTKFYQDWYADTQKAIKDYQNQLDKFFKKD